MARWSEIEDAVPELAARARELLEAHTHLTMATLRRDGSPRISGTEINLAGDELYIGCMWKSVKALDLRRDPRIAIHSGSADPPDWHADAKLAGRAEEITDAERVREINGGEAGRSHLFRIDVEELTVVGLNEERTKLVIESWHAGRGITRRER